VRGARVSVAGYCRPMRGRKCASFAISSCNCTPLLLSQSSYASSLYISIFLYFYISKPVLYLFYSLPCPTSLALSHLTYTHHHTSTICRKNSSRLKPPLSPALKVATLGTPYYYLPSTSLPPRPWSSTISSSPAWTPCRWGRHSTIPFPLRLPPPSPPALCPR